MKIRLIFLEILLVFVLSSCARAPIKEVSLPSGPFTVMGPDRIVTSPAVPRQDVIHEVAPGETLWRISKMYDVSVDDIAMANEVQDITQLEKGQKLFIPNAAPLISIIPLYPSSKWKYIIIHHSATDVGNALSFDYVHINKKNWKSLGYHFVIDNGTQGTKNGHIEVAPRWLHQEDGAHCKADSMNSRGIGICLVGNFDTEEISSRQMESLMYLVNILKKYYNIDDKHILGHGQVNGAATDCPGKSFPWNEFRRNLE
jgi:N-acetylmuramoyl-L-alanine amidase